MGMTGLVVLIFAGVFAVAALLLYASGSGSAEKAKQVQATRMSDGTRKVTSIAEITGMEEHVISMQEIFTFNKKGIGPDGKVIGAFQPTRIRPKFLERLRVSGIVLPPSLFEKETPVNY